MSRVGCSEPISYPTNSVWGTLSPCILTECSIWSKPMQADNASSWYVFSRQSGRPPPVSWGCPSEGLVSGANQAIVVDLRATIKRWAGVPPNRARPCHTFRIRSQSQQTASSQRTFLPDSAIVIRLNRWWPRALSRTASPVYPDGGQRIHSDLDGQVAVPGTGSQDRPRDAPPSIVIATRVRDRRVRAQDSRKTLGRRGLTGAPVMAMIVVQNNRRRYCASRHG